MTKKKGAPVVEETDIITVNVEGIAPKVDLEGGGYRISVGPEHIHIMSTTAWSAVYAFDREHCIALTRLMAEAVEAYKWVSLVK